MSRKSEFQTQNPNPAKRFLEWKSDDKCFAYYDKEKKTNVKIKLPFKFLVLKEMHTVKGFHDKTNSGIYANEVKFIGRQELTVKSFGGANIAKGLYKNIKAEIMSAGGHYYKSLYIMASNGEIMNLAIKGSAAGEWGEFTKKTRSRLYDEWIGVKGAENHQKGKTKYSTPVFMFHKSLSDAESDQADEAYKVLQEYMKKYDQAPEQETEVPSRDPKEIEVVDPEVVEAEAGEASEIEGELIDDLDF